MCIDDDEYCCHPDEGGICLVMLYLLPGRYFATLSMTAVNQQILHCVQYGRSIARQILRYAQYDTAVNQQILHCVQYDTAVNRQILRYRSV